MANGLANIRNIDEQEEMRRQAALAPSPEAGVPFAIGSGLRRAAGAVGRTAVGAAEAAVPVATSVVDATSLVPRAVAFGAGQFVRGITGRPPTQFRRAPFTAEASRILQPSPVEIAQREAEQAIPPAPVVAGTAQGLGGPAASALPAPITPAASTLAPTALAPTIVPTTAPETPVAPAEAGTVAAGLRRPAGPFGEIAPGVIRNLTRDPETGEPFTMTLMGASYGGTRAPTLREPFVDASKFAGGAQEMAAANAAIADYNKGLLDQYRSRVADFEAQAAGIPREQAQAELFQAQAAAAPLEAESRIGLRRAQEALATRSAEAAKLLTVNVEEPTGAVDALGQPVTRRKQVVYNPDTGEFIDPAAPRQQPQQVSPVANLRAEYDRLSEEEKGVVERHFADRDDVSPEEVLSYINTLR